MKYGPAIANESSMSLRCLSVLLLWSTAAAAQSESAELISIRNAAGRHYDS